MGWKLTRIGFHPLSIFVQLKPHFHPQFSSAIHSKSPQILQPPVAILTYSPPILPLQPLVTDRIRALITCEVTRDENTEDEIMFSVRGLIAATMKVEKHRFGGLKSSQYIYANKRGLCFKENVEARFNDLQRRIKALEERLQQIEDGKSTMQPLQPTAIGICCRFFANYRKWNGGKPVDGDMEDMNTGNEDLQGGNIMIDYALIRHGHMDDPHTFHEIYGITHDTAKPYLGIYSSPLQLFYVY